MENYRCIVCGKEMKSTVNPLSGGQVPHDESHLIKGFGYACSDECVTVFANKREEEAVRKQIEDMKKEVEDTMQMARIYIPAITEVIAENKDEFLRLMKPLTEMVINSYSNVLIEAIVGMDDVRKVALNARVSSIIEATEALKNAGFTRDQAVLLLSK